MKRNWIKIKNEYITTDISLRKLARKYNVSFNTVRCRAKKGLWFHEKKQIQHKCITKASQKIDEKIEKFTEELTDKILLKHYKISDKLIEILEQSSDEAKKYVDKIRIGTGQGEFTEELKVFELEAVNESKLNILVSALDKLQKMQRQTLKIIDAKDEKKIEIDCKKLDIDYEKLKHDKQVHEDRMAIEVEKLERGTAEDDDTPTTIIYNRV